MPSQSPGPSKPHTVVPVNEISLVLYPDDRAVGLQFKDGAGNEVFLWLPGSLLERLGTQLIDVTKDYPETLNWEPTIPKSH